MLAEKHTVRLAQQGFGDLSKDELERLAIWLRILPSGCAMLSALATVSGSSMFFYFLTGIAIFATFYKNHPLEILYNSLISNFTGTPQLPPNKFPRKAACAIAAVVLATIGLSFSNQEMIVGYMLGGSLTAIATIKSLTYYCPVAHAIWRLRPSLITA